MLDLSAPVLLEGSPPRLLPQSQEGNMWFSDQLAPLPPFRGVDSFSGHRRKEGSLDLSYWKLAQGLDRNGEYPHAPIRCVPWSLRQNGPATCPSHPCSPTTDSFSRLSEQYGGKEPHMWHVRYVDLSIWREGDP